MVDMDRNPVIFKGRKLGCWLAAGVVLLLIPDTAFAWGPAVHIGLGATLLDHLVLVPSAIGALLTRYSLDYLYGNIAADIVFAKRLSKVKQFCHHWSTAFGLLEKADNDRAKAFAYGYLSHLAADTVAHGKFVPRQVALSHTSVNVGHFFWELRADAMEPTTSRKQLEAILKNRYDCHHATLAEHMDGTFLAYDLNRMLFHHINALSVRHSIRRGLGIWNERSRWHLSQKLIAGYRSECLDRMQAILTDGSQSALVREDPNGTSALMQVSVQRRENRRRKRRGLAVQARIMEHSRGFAPDPSSRLVTELRSG